MGANLITPYVCVLQISQHDDQAWIDHRFLQSGEKNQERWETGEEADSSSSPERYVYNHALSQCMNALF